MQYYKVTAIIFTITLLVGSEPYSSVGSNRININLDTGWLFIAADNAGYSGTTAGEASFSKVCIPHANVILKHAYQSESAFRIVSWYRRHITPAASLNGRRFLLEFQAVSISAVVYVNGTKVGEHRGGYTPFTLDITDKVTTGQDNVIAVQVDSRQQSGVPPEGGSLDYMIFGGIVRHVNLIVTDPLHVEWVFASTQNPSQTAPTAPTITAKTKVVNGSASQKSCTVTTKVVDVENNVVAGATGSHDIPANTVYEFSQTTGAIADPQLWDIDHPNLYCIYTQVQDGSTFVDEFMTRTGVRSLTMNKTDGQCYLNGKAIKLRGLNRHETYPYIGRAAAKRLQRKDADILKYDLGCNIVRTSHYPQAPDFLDRCDEIGLLVLEEIPGWAYIGNDAWKKLEQQTLKDMVIRDRNHPCIMTWGVRINESADDNEFYQTTNDSAHFYDPTRLTCGVRRSNSDPATSFLEDIWTQNFATPSSNPSNMPTITSEWCGHNLDPQAHSWDNDEVQIGQITDGSYGHAKGQNASYAAKIWGGLLGWCAFDYASSHANATTNETGRGKNSYISPHGVASVFRLPKLAGYFYQSQRDPAFYGPMVRICNYWTSSSPTSVLVVSNCDQVELFQDGTSLGKKTAGNLYTSLPHPCFSWNVTFKSGELKAIGYRGGSQAATHIVKTPGSPAGLTVVPDTAMLYEGGDMTRVVVSIVDASGQLLHLNDDSVSLSATGADFIGEAKTSLEGGQTAFYVKTKASQTGTITCQASAGSLSASATIAVVQGSPVSINGPSPARTPFLFTNKPQYFKVCGNRFTLPGWAQKGAKVQVYDLSGRVLYSVPPINRVIYLTKTGSADGVKVVKIILGGRAIKEHY
jgi:beta-galactosidase